MAGHAAGGLVEEADYQRGLPNNAVLRKGGDRAWDGGGSWNWGGDPILNADAVGNRYEVGAIAQRNAQPKLVHAVLNNSCIPDAEDAADNGHLHNAAGRIP